MSLFVKICGITDPGAAQACVDAGVDAVGFVFAASPRRVTAARASEISAVIPRSVKKVAVFRRPSRADVEEVLRGFEPDLVQADHDAIGGDRDFEFLPVYRETVDVDPTGSMFLYEGAVSGVGRGVDLERAVGVARLGEMILAGGLRPDNVGSAIEKVRPFGVDVSSGVEVEPGVKSPALIRSFVAAARAAQERLVST